MDFDEAFRRDHLDPSNVIRKHLSRGSPGEALVFYSRIRRKGNYFLGLIPLVLKVCSCVPSLLIGKALHSESIKSGVCSDITIRSSLISMYAKCEGLVDARKVFDEMSERNVVTWNAMIGGYMRNGDVKSAYNLFNIMPTRNAVTWIEMINGFSRTGETGKARELFNRVPTESKNVKTWTVMVDGYTSKGEMDAAREIFENMPERNFFVWSSLISGYCKIGNVSEARAIFDQIPVKNLVNWNSLISGYAQNGFAEEALEAFYKMKSEGFEADAITASSVLSACAQSGRLDVGKEIHFMIHQRGIKLNVFVLNALIDMYAKCGDLTNARLIFDSTSLKNTACWNSLISGLAIHGQSKEALQFFKRMETSYDKPDKITFLSALSACVHGGYVDEGLEIFSEMAEAGVEPDVKHYSCLVDLLGRKGRLKEAYDLVEQMPVKPNDVVLGAFLGACRIHSDANMAEQVMKMIENVCVDEMDCDEENHYVLVSNIYATSGRWENAERLRMAMADRGIQKAPGCSSVIC